MNEIVALLLQNSPFSRSKNRVPHANTVNLAVFDCSKNAIQATEASSSDGHIKFFYS